VGWKIWIAEAKELLLENLATRVSDVFPMMCIFEPLRGAGLSEKRNRPFGKILNRVVLFVLKFKEVLSIVPIKSVKGFVPIFPFNFHAYLPRGTGGIESV